MYRVIDLRQLRWGRDDPYVYPLTTLTEVVAYVAFYVGLYKLHFEPPKNRRHFDGYKEYQKYEDDFLKKTSYAIIDADNNIVARRKIYEVFYHNGFHKKTLREAKEHFKARPWLVRDDYEFRNGPLPDSNPWVPLHEFQNYCYYRVMSHRQAIVEASREKSDEDFKDYEIYIRGKQRHPVNPWDDRYPAKARDRNWKKLRKIKYKDKITLPG